MNVICFHNPDEENGYLSNWYLSHFTVNGIDFSSMEQFMMYQKAGTLNMTELTAFMQSRENPAEFYAIGVLILFGFAAKAGLFPLHIWLPNAYTVAPAPSSALLSCLLTKTGVFGTIIVSCKLFLHDAAWGQFILILGIITMVLAPPCPRLALSSLPSGCRGFWASITPWRQAAHCCTF